MEDDEDVGAHSSESEGLLSKLERDNQPVHVDEDDDVVVVLNDGDLQLQQRNHIDLQSPLRSITDVLREAENIMTDGPLQISTTKDKQQVLIDEVDVEYSPRKQSFQPIEIVVRHNKVVEQEMSDSDDDAELGKGDHDRKRSGLGVLHEGTESTLDDPCSSSAAIAKKSSKWTRGHRRAWSMPNAKGEKMTLAVIQDKETNEDGNRHRRRIVKYKLHPQKERLGAEATVTEIDGDGHGIDPSNIECGLRFDMSMLNAEADDHELEVEINEEEVVLPGEEGRGARTIVKRFWQARWKATNFDSLPDWLQDNEYLRTGHRPPIPSFSNCFKSIFALHTETGNIWTHMYGCVAFIGVAIWFLTRPAEQVQLMEKLIFSAFFLGAVT